MYTSRFCGNPSIMTALLLEMQAAGCRLQATGYMFNITAVVMEGLPQNPAVATSNITIVMLEMFAAACSMEWLSHLQSLHGADLAVRSPLSSLVGHNSNPAWQQPG